MTVIADMVYDGKQWILNIVPEDSEKEDIPIIEIPITVQKKDELEKIGIEIYNSDL